MRANTKLIVEGLGRIEQAEIVLHPLTLFIGENNTGKSYLATLLWAIQQPDVSNHLLAHGRTLDSFRACEHTIERWLKDAPSELQPPHPIAEQDFAVFSQWLAEALELAKDDIVRDAFNHERSSIGHLSVVPGRGQFAISALTRDGDRPAQVSVATDRGGIGTSVDSPEHRARSIALIACTLAGLWQFGTEFLPASRTGFMLLYRAQLSQVVDTLLLTTAQQRPRQPDLTKPSIRFLQKLAKGFNPGEGRYASEARLLEDGLRGHLIVQSGGAASAEYLYRYSETKPPLTMAMSSSIVTELAPIVLTLREPSAMQWLFIEEPEAHLHPAMQRLLGQAVTRLVRKGLCLCITTHSENLCQQINNFIKIGAAANRGELQAQFGYSDQDHLLPEEVAGYEFIRSSDSCTSVREVSKIEQGLAMPTFNQALVELSRETLALEDALEEPTRSQE